MFVHSLTNVRICAFIYLALFIEKVHMNYFLN